MLVLSMPEFAACHSSSIGPSLGLEEVAKHIENARAATPTMTAPTPRTRYLVDFLAGTCSCIQGLPEYPFFNAFTDTHDFHALEQGSRKRFCIRGGIIAGQRWGSSSKTVRRTRSCCTGRSPLGSGCSGEPLWHGEAHRCRVEISKARPGFRAVGSGRFRP